jgi:hypothetical protein
MSKTFYFYLPLPLKTLDELVEGHKSDFESLLEESFSEAELVAHEKLIDSLCSIEVQPILSELTFEDFYPDENFEQKQRAFFDSCRSAICLDHLPFLETNPFQVTYLIDLLWTFEEVLIDQGGVSPLVFKKQFLEQLKKYKSLEALKGTLVPKGPAPKKADINNPIDQLLQEVSVELERVGTKAQTLLDNIPEKSGRILTFLLEDRFDSETLLAKTKLIPKDFGDALERLKFLLKKLH